MHNFPYNRLNSIYELRKKIRKLNLHKKILRKRGSSVFKYRSMKLKDW